MLAYYGTRISPHMTDTPEGYLICHDVPIARTGTQKYLARELLLDGDPERVILVDRHPEDVFEAATLASFEGKDVTYGHPPENVGPENHAAYSKGHVQNVRRGGDFILADLHIKDQNLISDIKNDVTREVSCGYLCSYVADGTGYKQTHIRGNHVAIVPRGRAGHDVAIKDQAAQPAEKGRNCMSKFAEAILSALGMAAKEAKDQTEVDALVKTAATALDAAPTEKELAVEPARATEDAKPVVPAEPVVKTDDTAAMLREIKDMLGAALRTDGPEKKLSDEGDLDALAEELGGGKDSAITIPAGEADETLDEAARDAAVALLKKVRPAVAAIRDAEEKAMVTDALLSAIKGPDVMSEIVKATTSSAKAAADAASKTSFEKICADQAAEYAARNPHKKEG